MSEPQSLGLDVEILRRLSRDRLVRVLEDAPGSKDLIIDGDLMKMFDRIAGTSLLRNHGVGKMYRLERLPPPVDSGQRVYLVKPSLISLKYIAEHVHADRVNHPHLQVHVVVVPRLVSWISSLLEEEGLYGALTLHEFTPEFIPLDDDLLTLEMTSFYRDAFLEGDFSGCVSVARAINTLQDLYGRIPNVLAHGRAATAVVNALDLLTQNNSPKKSNQIPEIGYLFIFDRDADYVTPLLTQLTYEGALDEHFGIQAGVVELPGSVVGQEMPRKIQVNSQDTIFDNIRNMHFGGVSRYLVTRAREVKAKRDQTQTMTTEQMKEFVANELRAVKTLQASLDLHLQTCEAITSATQGDLEARLLAEHGLVTGAGGAASLATDLLENLLARMLPMPNNLRLLCLYSLAQDGLSRKEYKRLASQVVAAHGHRHLCTLHNLRQLGLLTVNEGSTEGSGSGGTQLQERLAQMTSLLPRRGSGWKEAARRLGLVGGEDDHIDLHSPTHMSYVFNGAYTPAVAKIVSDALASRSIAPLSLTEALKLLPGTTVTRSSSPGSPVPPRVALVVLLGGLTFAEIAALRLLAVISSTRIILASTSTITGSVLLSSVAHL
ncbi:hypothetical protein Pmani_019775 [Petrolisthes manimaculis]|uniref:Vacuolar protein sorting-associated protein 33A n=1 Tax=Petrolisthes manimaculis TaxID=1843537 RepID=A0AAE1U3P3_9EUCA|nr:hypothetical protein Pmani_019775 [Petrolisthes manimaculis]